MSNVAKLQEKVAKLTNELNKATQQLAAVEALSNIAVGSLVSFKFGRGETAVEKSGIVTGTKDAENGVKMLAVETGSGFDKVVLRIPAASVTFVSQQGVAASA